VFVYRYGGEKLHLGDEGGVSRNIRLGKDYLIDFLLFEKQYEVYANENLNDA